MFCFIIGIKSAIKVLKNLRPYTDGKMKIRLYSNFVPWWFYMIDDRMIRNRFLVLLKFSSQKADAISYDLGLRLLASDIARYEFSQCLNAVFDKPLDKDCTEKRRKFFFFYVMFRFFPKKKEEGCRGD